MESSSYTDANGNKLTARTWEKSQRESQEEAGTEHFHKWAQVPCLLQKVIQSLSF